MTGSSKLGKTYPHHWMSGAGEVEHRLYRDCQRCKAQAKFRKQEWNISILEYIALWMQDDRHLRKGRSADCLTMTRIDKTKPWSKDNVEFLTRREHMRSIYTGIVKKDYIIEDNAKY
jgi:hypothetical protein